MIQINTLKITQDGNYLVINASVKDLSYYNDVLIGTITIDNQDTFSVNGPSTTPLYQLSFTEIGSKTTKEGSKEVKGEKTVSISVPASAIKSKNGNLNDDIFYIYFTAVGSPSADVPCGMDNKNTLGVAVNIRPIYTKGMGYIKQIEKSCEIPKGFINYILEYKALDLALQTKNFIQANKYWNKFFKGKEVVSVNTNGCGCTQ